MQSSPAYQEYAANLLSRREYRLMSLAAKGLLHHIRLECWVNGSVPSSCQMLARIVGYSEQEVASLIAECHPFLKVSCSTYIAPDLEDYRARLERNNQQRSDAGKASAEKRKAQRSLKSRSNENPTDVENSLQRKSNAVNQIKPNQTHAVREAEDYVHTQIDTWVASYVEAEHG